MTNENKEILRVEVGSTAHGTGLEGQEDRDELSIVVETPAQVYGLDRQGFKTKMIRTQPEGVRSGPGDLDLTIYSLRTFMNLAASGNPSILATLWAPVIEASAEGVYLRAGRTVFIGRHIIPRYRGYMRQQGLRLLGLAGSGHGHRGGGRREELIEAHGYDTKYAMHAARLGYQCIELLTTFNLDMPMLPVPGDWLRSLRQGKVPFEEWWDTCLWLDSEMEKLQQDEGIRKTANVDTIIDMSIVIHNVIHDRLKEEVQ
jgi:uncharacterized protein